MGRGIMVIIVYGTTGELIKVLPLIKRLPEEQQIRVSTSQQPDQLEKLMREASIPAPHLTIAHGWHNHDLQKMSDMFFWLSGMIVRYPRNRRRLKKALHGRKATAVLVHGDTVTTVLGALWGRMRRLPVMHIEAGLRSGNWRHPFPEEIDRHLTSRFATTHFAPGAIPVKNLRAAKAKGQIIDTQYNTVLDSLRLAQQTPTAIQGITALPAEFFVVSIHRNELLAQPKELKKLLERIAAKAATIPCIFLDHPVTKARVKQLGLDAILDAPGITRAPKLEYFQFIGLATKAAFIVTDSGGLQEEAAYLGIPCLVHRMATERQEGLGENVVLSLFDDSRIQDFLDHTDTYRRAPVGTEISPTQTICDFLVEHAYLTVI
jgi:UDP-N-acetylglucosamine 2-epimerase (non-hydrolysing)